MNKEIRDNDIGILSSINKMVGEELGMNFILTGSYSVEALTQSYVEHEDIDGNVFSSDLIKARSRLLTLNSRVVTDKNSRVEFDVVNKEVNLPTRRVEICLIKTVGVSNTNPSNFYLEDKSGKPHEVPTELVPLIDSKGNEFVFRVKSLSYAIATWVIRISEAASNQRRPVRSSDISHLALLLKENYKYENVTMIMRNHPQMPLDIEESTIFERAIDLVNKHL